MARHHATEEQLAFGRAVAEQLSTLRRFKDLTTSRLAMLTHVSVDTIRALEGGKIASPGFRTMHLLAEALDVSLDELARRASVAASMPEVGASAQPRNPAPSKKARGREGANG
jgi:transcriptional regulator with XRE-family HTH domain